MFGLIAFMSFARFLIFELLSILYLAVSNTYFSVCQRSSVAWLCKPVDVAVDANVRFTCIENDPKRVPNDESVEQIEM